MCWRLPWSDLHRIFDEMAHETVRSAPRPDIPGTPCRRRAMTRSSDELFGFTPLEASRPREGVQLLGHVGGRQVALLGQPGGRHRHHPRRHGGRSAHGQQSSARIPGSCVVLLRRDRAANRSCQPLESSRPRGRAPKTVLGDHESSVGLLRLAPGSGGWQRTRLHGDARVSRPSRAAACRGYVLPRCA
jgi:hypothetical protein